MGTIIQSIFCAQSGAGSFARCALSPDPAVTDCPWVSEDEVKIDYSQISSYQNIENINWHQEYAEICKQIKLYVGRVLAPCENNTDQMSTKLCQIGRGFGDSW